LLHDLLPEVPQVLYLDCDLLVTADLAELYLTLLEGCPYAAVPDIGIPYIGHELESLFKDLPKLTRLDDAYHNSGVLLLNLDKLRELEVSALVGRALDKIEARFGDQSLLNGVFHGQWKILPRRWNRQILLGREYSVFPEQPQAIWHFFSKLKPWHFHSRNARGLLKQWQDERDAIGWIPTVEPTIQVQPSLLMDLVKQGRSWVDCRRSAFSSATPARQDT
jgi:lipopolysaccharide biosynthesis glycosyltransferase